MQEILSAIKKAHPLVQCITNTVTVNDCANILYALSASPIMAHDVHEVEEIQEKADALVLNLGATESFEAMGPALASAKKAGHPVVLDPVGTGISSYRRQFASGLFKAGGITLVRGNYSEIRALSGNIDPDSHGVDSGEDSEIRSHAIRLARTCHVLVVATGPIDILTDGDRVFANETGAPEMSEITGSGCMLSCLCGAFLAGAGKSGLLSAAYAACRLMGLAGEEASREKEKRKGGNLTFRLALIDSVYKLAREDQGAGTP